jgi:hypothetical protein
VAQALLFLGILCTGTTRKNAMGVPEELIKLLLELNLLKNREWY